jgi:NitT/TauT family transport system substrate-binding protein
LLERSGLSAVQKSGYDGNRNYGNTFAFGDGSALMLVRLGMRNEAMRHWVAIFTACFIGSAIGPTAAQNLRANSPGPTQKVVVRFTWKLKGEFAPLFVALDKGYYAAEGLDVELAEGSGAETVVKLIGAGTDKIGYGPATVIAEAVNQGLPVEVIAVYQPSVPIGLVSFPDVPLSKPTDLEGKKLGTVTGETFGNMLEPFAKLNHVDLSKVTVVRMDGAARNAQFLLRKLDVASVYLNNEKPIFEKKAGVKFNVINIGDFGLKLLGASFFVNRTFAEQQPDLLRKLLRATAKGYLDAKRDVAGAVAIMSNHMTVKLDRDVLEQEVRETLDATPVPKDIPLGWQSAEAWKSNLDLLKATNSIQTVRDLQSYYTNAYLK